MDDELFETPQHLSPKLAWLKKHRLATEEANGGWRCRNGGYTHEAYGVSEDEAILAYCDVYGLKHWTLE
jgi:hypothetical protein